MRRRRTGGEAAGLPLTPLIDVVFLMLVFFVLAVKPADVFAHFDANLPRPGPPGAPLLNIRVGADALALNGRAVDEAGLGRLLGRLAALDASQPVVVVSERDAPHGRLVGVLDACARAGLANLSVVSGAGEKRDGREQGKEGVSQ